MRFAVATSLALLLSGPVFANDKPHHCFADAKARAADLLRLHFEGPEGFVGERAEIERPTWSIDSEVMQLPSIRALKGKGRLDVLEVWGYIYRASYRMRFIYAQIEESCLLMGQEILEEADPY